MIRQRLRRLWKRLPRFIPLALVALGLSLAVFAGISLFTVVYAKGYSYLFDNPEACVNCHIMRDNYHGWEGSSHRSITCNGCHVPHQLIRKYIAKATNGLRHSYAFTFEDVQVPAITPADLHALQDNCIACHSNSVSMIRTVVAGEQLPCTRCHRGVGHVN
jgi:cytochrome c nitrite reductase small subunit